VLAEAEGGAAKTLESLGISLQAVRAQLEELIGHGDTVSAEPLPFAPRAKKVFELALREAVQLGDNAIGTEHILLALVREGEGVAAQVLRQFGADLDQVVSLRREARGRLSDPPPTEAPAAREARQGFGKRFVPARCASCGVSSPDCGTLFTRPSGVLVCEHCIPTDPPDSPPV
jgi:ATP-dependent Clp protease ATP-binding subunit ClpC